MRAHHLASSAVALVVISAFILAGALPAFAATPTFSATCFTPRSASGIVTH